MRTVPDFKTSIIRNETAINRETLRAFFKHALEVGLTKMDCTIYVGNKYILVFQARVFWPSCDPFSPRSQNYKFLLQVLFPYGSYSTFSMFHPYLSTRSWLFKNLNYK